MLRRLLIFSVCVGVFVSYSSAQEVTPEQVAEVVSLFKTEKYSAALEEVNTLIKQDNKNADLFYWKGNIQFETGDFANAKNSYLAGIKAKTRYPFNHVGVAKVFYTEDMEAEAQEKLDKALYYDKGRDVNVKFAVADAYLLAKKFKEAEVLLLQAQQEAPDNPESYIALGDYYWKKGVSQLALDQYQKAIEKDPNFITGYTRVGQIKIEEQEYDEGARSLNKAIAIDPNFAPPYKYRGELYLKAKRYENARDDLKKYVELAGNDLAARIQYASYIYLTGDYSEVLKQLESIESDTITNLMRRLMGYCYAEMGQLEKAEEKLDEYFSKYEFVIADDYENYGKIFLKRGDLAKADENFAKVISMDAERVVLYRDLAREFEDEAKACRKSKDKECYLANYGKEAHYRKLYLENKDEKTLNNYYNLAKAFYNADDFDNANTYFDECIGLKDDWLTPYNYKLRMGYKLDQANLKQDSTVTWNTKEPAESIIQLLGSKKPEEMKKSEKSALVSSYVILARHSLDPTGEGQSYNCEGFMIYYEKLKFVDPSYDDLEPVKDYCDQVKALPQGGK